MKKLLLLITILTISINTYSQFKHAYTETVEDTLIAKKQAILHNTVIEKNIGSPNFFSGLTGYGWKLYGDSAWLTIDKLTVRKSMDVYEMLINKLRSINGGIVISAANAKIDSIVTIGNIYHIFPKDTLLTFSTNDIARCQVFLTPNIRYYQLEIDSLANNNKSFYAHIIDGYDTPAIDDDLVQFGNTQNTERQGLLYLTANDYKSPYLDILDSVNSTNYSGKTKVRLGDLEGIITPIFGELTGYGIWSENAYLSGIINAKSGSNIYTKSEISDTLQSVNDEIRDTIRTIAETTTSSFLKYNDSIAARISKNKYTTDSIYRNGELYLINNNVSNNTSSIIQNANNITSKVSSVDYKADSIHRDSQMENIATYMTDNRTSITQNANNIASKVSSSTYNSNKSTTDAAISSNTSSLTQYADKLIAGFKVIGVDGIRTGRTEFDVNGLTIYNDDNVAVFSQNATTGDLSITGNLNATSGIFNNVSIAGSSTIGNFEIYGTTSPDGKSYAGLVANTTDAYMRVGTGDNYAAIGTNTFPTSSGGMVATGLFMATSANSYNTNYGIYAHAVNTGTNGTAYAGYFDGDVKVTNGGYVGHMNIPTSEIQSLVDSDNGYIDGYGQPTTLHYYFNNMNFTDDRWNYLPSADYYPTGDCITITNWSNWNITLKSRINEYINGQKNGTISLNDKGDSVILRATKLNVKINGTVYKKDCWMIINMAGPGGLGLGNY